jgi:thioredoxin-related protein
MKKILFALFAALSLSAAEIDWAHSYAEAQERAKKEQKNILLLITTESCRWCRRLESTTLQNDKVVKRINAEYVAVHVTRDKDKYPEDLVARRVPMSYFLKSDGEVIHDMMGFWNVEDYLSVLDDAAYEFKLENFE